MYNHANINGKINLKSGRIKILRKSVSFSIMYLFSVST